MKEQATPVMARVWKDNGAFELMFLYENNGLFPNGKPRIMCWSPNGGHGDGYYEVVMRNTRSATDEEADCMIRHYEEVYNCKLRRIYRRRRVKSEKP